MKSKLKVMFYLKKNQTKKEELSPVMGRIQVGKTMSQFSLKLKADANLWDTKAGRMIGKSALSQTINREINRVNLIIHARYKELLSIHLEVDAHDLKNVTQGIASSQDTVLDHFGQLKETIAQRVGVDYSEAALGQYIISYNALESYIQEQLNLSDIPFKSLTYSFIEEYSQYLRVDRKLSVGTSRTYLVYFRKVVRAAVNQGIIFRDPFHGFEPERAEVVHKSLTKEELDKFMSVEPSVRQQKKTKDLFLFATFTGLSYIDMKNLKYAFVMQMQAQRYLPGLKGIQITAGVVDGFHLKKGDKQAFCAGLAYSTYLKNGNRWVFGAEYLQKQHQYKDLLLPISQITAEGGYYIKFLSDPSKTFFLSAGVSAMAGYEMVNRGKELLYDGSTIQNKEKFLGGGAITMEAEIYLSDRCALLVNARERILFGSSVSKFHLQANVGFKIIIN